MKRAQAQMIELERSEMGWSAANDDIIPGVVILNEMTERGVTIFTTRPMPVGTRVGFQLVGFGSFHVRGRIIGCEMIPTTGRVLSENGSYRYRIRLAFEFETSDDVYAVSDFARSIRRTYFEPAA